MWQVGVLDITSSKGLLNSVFLANGKNLYLQTPSAKDRNEGGEFILKNHSGSYKEKGENVVMKHNANLSVSECCYIGILRPVTYQSCMKFLAIWLRQSIRQVHTVLDTTTIWHMVHSTMCSM